MTKEDLRVVLQGTGLTYREARLVLKVAVEEWAAAALRGEEVDFPFVTIKPIKNKRTSRVWRLGKIMTINRKKFRWMLKQKIW